VADGLIGLVLTVLVLLGLYFQWGPLERLEYGAYDLGLSLRQAPSARSTTSPVTVVAIDDPSIAGIGRWPWPRHYIAQMIWFLQQADAKVVGVNIFFSEPDLNQGLMEVRNILKEFESGAAKSGQLFTMLKEAESRLDNDARLAASLEESKRVVLPVFFQLGNAFGGERKDMPEVLKRNSAAIPGLASGITAVAIHPPIPEFAERALALGHLNVITDRDGAVRSDPLLVNFENRFFPSLPFQLTLKYLNYDIKDLTAKEGEGLRIGRLVIPVLPDNRLLVSYSQFPTVYSFLDVVSNKVPPEAFKDKIVLIALNAVGLGALQLTPLGPNVPSFVSLSNVITDIINNRDFVVRPDWALWVEIAVVVLFGLFLALAIPRMKAWLSALVSLVLLLAWCGASLSLLVTQGWWLKTVSPAALLVVGYIVLVSKRFLWTEKTKEHMEADSIETNKMLGLSFQGQGMLDMAFDKFRKCPVEDESVKELVYNLGLDFERKRMFNKAVAAYEHIRAAGPFKDIDDRIKKLKVAGETMIFGLGGAKKDGTVLIDSAETKPTLGRYEVVKELGRGAMGTVYLGKDPRINREVAIKTLRYEDIDDEQLAEVKKRFFREAEAAGRLSHPNIVTIYDVGEDYEIAYMAMELLSGSDLTKYTQKDNLLPIHEVVRIVTATANALDYAHQHDVVHRDIKPANIMILKNGEIRVADFGIARVVTSSKTQTGVVLGTPSYMSPEQIAGQKVDGRSDLFSLGVVLFELLSGQKPFQGDSIATLMFNITTGVAPRLADLVPDLPPGFQAVLDKSMAKDREQRYQTGAAFVEDLTQALQT
jgi:serine/threonine-protein kinase